MKYIKSNVTLVIMLAALFILPACKAKKLIQKPVPPQPVPAQPAATRPAAPATPPPPPPVPPAKPDYNFNNIQFEFNSSVLKTESYPILDKASAAMKMDLSVKFELRGYASKEGTRQHNLILSQDRANSVRLYLVNSGVPGQNLTAKGYGTRNPVGDNSTEDGRVLNRRVEIHKQN